MRLALTHKPKPGNTGTTSIMKTIKIDGTPIQFDEPKFINYESTRHRFRIYPVGDDLKHLEAIQIHQKYVYVVFENGYSLRCKVGVMSGLETHIFLSKIHLRRYNATKPRTRKSSFNRF